MMLMTMLEIVGQNAQRKYFRAGLMQLSESGGGRQGGAALDFIYKEKCGSEISLLHRLAVGPISSLERCRFGQREANFRISDEFLRSQHFRFDGARIGDVFYDEMDIRVFITDDTGASSRTWKGLSRILFSSSFLASTQGQHDGLLSTMNSVGTAGRGRGDPVLMFQLHCFVKLVQILQLAPNLRYKIRGTHRRCRQCSPK